MFINAERKKNQDLLDFQYRTLETKYEITKLLRGIYFVKSRGTHSNLFTSPIFLYPKIRVYPTMSNGMSIQDHLDYVSSRVVISGGLGLLSGSFIALYRGHDSIFRTASRTGFSCALVGTACFSMERLAYIGVTQYLLKEHEREELYQNSKKQYYLKLYSHAIGGVLGGAYVGGLFTGKLMRGAFVFAPIMLLIAMTEEKVIHEIRESMLPESDIESYEEEGEPQESITK